MPMSTTLILISILGLLILILLVWAIRAEMKLRRFFRGKKGTDLEDTINTLLKEIEDLRRAKDSLFEKSENLDQRLKQSIQGVELIRFNPFRESGGNQSFSAALLNEKGDGIVLTSLYSREKVSVFAKPIKEYKSEYELTAEEKEAISRARLS